MSRVENVDYRDLAVKAKDIRNHAKGLNEQFSKIYLEITTMHQSWYGKRYNELAKDFNELAPSINEMLKLTYGEIPFALETIANNFSQVDTGSKTTSAQQTQETKMPNIPTPNDVGMRFMEVQVKDTKTKVVQGFKNANEKMRAIENTYNKIAWRSESAEAFRAKFTKLKNQITKEIEQLKTQFDKLMEQAMEDLRVTEKKNTVNKEQKISSNFLGLIF